MHNFRGWFHRCSNMNTRRTSALEKLIVVKHLKYLNDDNNRQFSKSSLRTFLEICAKILGHVGIGLIYLE